MKVWVTKWCKGQGILEFQGARVVEQDDGSPPTMACVESGWYVHKPYWHETLQAAQEHVGELFDLEQRRLLKRLLRLDDLRKKAMRVTCATSEVSE